MSDIDLNKRVKTLSIGKLFSAYTGVIIHAGQDSAGNELTYYAGDSTGYVLEIGNPLGTQEMAYNILSSLQLRGVRYQPYDADGALLDPAAEMGDGLTINGVTSFIAANNKQFGRLMSANVAAPFDEEVNHEYKYEPRTQREFKRESAYSRARLTINETEIAAKVSRTGGNASSFGWVLDAESHTWYANDAEVMRVNRNGLKVTGEIVATSGVIGGCQIVNGVLQVDAAHIRNINADYITAGTLSVDRIAANSITGGKIGIETITGGSGGNIGIETIAGGSGGNIGIETITGGSGGNIGIETITGGSGGNMGIETITGGSGGNIVGSGVSTYNTVSGINTNLGYGAAYGLATQSGGTPAAYFSVYSLYARSHLYLAYGGQMVELYCDSSGNVKWHS